MESDSLLNEYNCDGEYPRECKGLYDARLSVRRLADLNEPSCPRRADPPSFPLPRPPISCHAFSLMKGGCTGRLAAVTQLNASYRGWIKETGTRIVSFPRRCRRPGARFLKK